MENDPFAKCKVLFSTKFIFPIFPIISPALECTNYLYSTIGRERKDYQEVDQLKASIYVETGRFKNGKRTLSQIQSVRRKLIQFLPYVSEMLVGVLWPNKRLQE